MTDRDPLAESLASLLPSPASLNRDLLNYEAGRAAGARSTGRWRLAAGLGFTSSAVLVAFGLARPPAVIVQSKVVVVEPSPSPASTAPAAEANTELVQMLKLRNAVLADGVDELPPAPPGPGLAMTSLRRPFHPID